MFFGSGQGGGAAPMSVDHINQFLAEAFGSGAMAGGTPQAAAQATTPPKAAPTSASTFRNLPRIKVRQVDLEANESNECSICIDEMNIGQEAIRIPCGHLYHEDCIKDWLGKSNECPVCRYELPTDNVEFEKGRKERMAGRKIRLRRNELTVKTAQELRRLAHFLCVDVSGCLEKSEFVNAILASSKVELVPCEGDPEPPEPTPVHAQAAADPLLTSMSIAELRRLAAARGVSLDGCIEKADIIRLLQA